MSNLKSQNYGNHKKFAPLYHFFLMPLSLVIFIAAIVHLFREEFGYSALLITGISLCIIVLTLIVRIFATQLQDRLIQHEENFRHMQLTGKPLDPRLSVKQIVALRFAGDTEFPALCKKAAESGMQPAAIKQSVTQWRADYHRV
ncbi:DUF6526 family protein [Paenibacillus spongiae]|uniref:DUF6526 family protein n=1 Tax=Paenibacillus spongiae TaxID=2909671 RepID=A0ABY5S7S4_9BACL|nr:DUF6526 family protein [Paenibacillus spongiae]UVI28378.1 DUF6526 family protein [Paenibacillus spongiae]